MNHFEEVCGVQDEMIRKLSRENSKLFRALKAVYTQKYGMDHNWAGMWLDCKIANCASKNGFGGRTSTAYAFGGNWESIEEMCPQCQAKEVLGEKDIPEGNL